MNKHIKILISKLDNPIGEKTIITIQEEQGGTTDNKDGLGKRTRGSNRKMVIDVSTNVSQIKEATEKMDKLEMQATEILENMG